MFSPSVIVGWVITLSRRAVYGKPAIIAVCYSGEILAGLRTQQGDT